MIARHKSLVDSFELRRSERETLTLHQERGWRNEEEEEELVEKRRRRKTHHTSGLK